MDYDKAYDNETTARITCREVLQGRKRHVFTRDIIETIWGESTHWMN